MPKKNRSGKPAKLSDHAKRLARMRERVVKPAAPNFSIIIDPPTFAEALRVHMDRHGETAAMLWNAITRRGENLDPATIVSWRKGNKAPRTVASMTYLQRIEERYALTPGYFRAKFPHPCRAIVRERRPVFSRSETSPACLASTRRF